MQARIAAALERRFVVAGFAEPGVAALREAAGVSLRTLYKYFPSREAMIVGALANRHERYIAFLGDGAPSGPGPAPVTHAFERLGSWLTDEAANGCLFVDALAAHPDSEAIRACVRHAKDETRALLGARIARALGRRGERPRAADAPLVETAFVLHEGVTAASIDGDHAPAIAAAIGTMRQLIGVTDAGGRAT